MGMAIVGLVTTAMPLGVAGWMALRLRREGRPMRPAALYVGRSGTFYMGLLLLVMGVSRPFGTLALLLVFIFVASAVIRFLLKLPRAVRRIPTAYRELGDSTVWRGER